MKQTINVIVLTNSELGWDCVMGVYTSFEQIQEDLDLDEVPTEDSLKEDYIITYKPLEIEYTTDFLHNVKFKHE